MNRLWTTAAVVTATLSSIYPLAAGAAQCRAVYGTLQETIVAGPDCLSPVGLCTVATVSGNVKGRATFTATSITPTADTPATAVVFVTGDTIVSDVKLGTALGTLSIKNAAAFRTAGTGDLLDLQTIVGGTGDFQGATGSLFVSGNVVGATGTSDFEGTICLP